MLTRRLSLILLLGLALVPGLGQARAGAIERIDLRVEGMT
jgi:hypothetical protein